MWMSKRMIAGPESAESAGVCEVTIGGDSVAVMAEGEMHGVGVASPGGYFWRPSAGDELLVIKCGGRENAAVGRMLGAAPVTLSEGEVYITSNGGAALHLRRDGCVDIIGTVLNNGAAFPSAGGGA